jgi:hypothetical protein
MEEYQTYKQGEKVSFSVNGEKKTGIVKYGYHYKFMPPFVEVVDGYGNAFRMHGKIESNKVN